MLSSDSPSRPLRALVIGAGPMADFVHLPILAGLRDSGRLELSLVCDLAPGRAGAARRKFGFAEECGDAVLGLEREDIDIVFIFASAQLHYEYGLMAVTRGKHLFVEKPVAPSFAQARHLAERAAGNGVIAVAGHNRRFYGALNAARAKAGRAGWRHVEAVFHKPMLGKPPQFGVGTWLAGNGIHALDALLFLMGGLPEEIAAFADPGADAYSAVMRWKDGRQGSFLCNNTAGDRREEYVLHAPGETVRIGDPGMEDGFSAEHAAFLEAVRTGVEPPHALSDVAASLFLCELIENGFSGPVRLPGATPAAPSPAPARPAGTGRTILVAQAAGLQAALTRLLPDYRLVSPSDVMAADQGRPDVAAAILGRGAPPLDAAMLDRMPGLAIVGVTVLSVARHDPAALSARGIEMVNASAAHAESVAEFALGLAILGRRRAFQSHGIMRQGGWGVIPRRPGLKGLLIDWGKRRKPTLDRLGLLSLATRAKTALVPALAGRPPTARDLPGSVVGLIGWSANAEAFTRRLLACGAHVLVWSEHAPAEEIRASGAVPAGLDEVLAADIVSLHRGLNDRTRHMLGAAELARLRPGAVLINIARGALIEPGALLARLRRGDVFACLDTYEEEPLARSHPLRRLPNVFLSSHIAGGSPDMQAAAAEEVVGKIAGFLNGDPTATIASGRLGGMT